MNKTLFNINDQVNILSTGEIGVIKEIISIIGEGDNTYLVSVDGKDRMYIESNLKLFRKKERIGHVDVDELSILVEVEDKMDDIISLLGLVKPSSEEDELSNACKLQKYLTLLEENINKKDVVTNNLNLKQLYNGLINGVGDYVTFSCMFSTILKRVDMQVYNVGVRDENDAFYMADLVYIGGKFYFFDVSLERDIYRDSDDEECILCCAGVGLNRYSEFFEPLCILEFGIDSKRGDLPKNISLDDISMEVVNNII